MSDLLIGSDNDLVVTNGDISLVLLDAAIRQDVQQTLQFLMGEWFLNNTLGIPYLQTILAKNPDLDLIQSILQNAVLDVNGVTDLVAFEFDYDSQTRSLSVTLQAKTTNGTVISAQTQIGPQGGAI